MIIHLSLLAFSMILTPYHYPHHPHTIYPHNHTIGIHERNDVDRHVGRHHACPRHHQAPAAMDGQAAVQYDLPEDQLQGEV
jgi:predicted nuclease with RNAse H fold